MMGHYDCKVCGTSPGEPHAEDCRHIPPPPTAVGPWHALSDSAVALALTAPNRMTPEPWTISDIKLRPDTPFAIAILGHADAIERIKAMEAAIAEATRRAQTGYMARDAVKALAKFLPAKPDPLLEVITALADAPVLDCGPEAFTKELREELAKRGLVIVEKGVW